MELAPADGRRSARTGRGGTALLALAALGVSLLLAEGVARAVLDPPRYHRNEPLQLDPQLGFRGIPGHRSRAADAEGALHALVLNRDGFRGRVLPSGDEPPGGAQPRRIAFVGDSFLLGAGVPEDALLTSRVESALRARGEPVEAWNLSAADYGTGQELLLLRRLGARLAPERVVLAVFPHNDVVNNFEGLAFRTRVSPGDAIRPYVVPRQDHLDVVFTHPLRARLRRHSRLFAVLEQRAVFFGTRHGLAWLQPFRRPEPEEQRIRQGRAPREHLEVFRSHPPGHLWEQAWQRTEALLAAFHDACRALDARLLVVVIPDLHQVQRIARDVEMDLRLRALGQLPLDRYLDWNLPERRLARLLREQSIDFVLLLPHLRRAAAAGEPLYLRDRHLSARGHARAAEAILEALDAQASAGARLAPGPEPDGRPVPLPDAARAPRWIEPGRPDHWPYRGEGWLPWQPEPDAPAAGALALQQASVALPVRGGELVVRGIAAARRYPLDIRLEWVGGPVQQIRIEKAGPFVLRTRLPPARLPRSDGWGTLVFASAEAAAPDESTGLIVQELGFAGR